MKKIYLVYLLALIVFASCDDNKLVPGGTATPAELELTVLDTLGKPVNGATVGLYANKENYSAVANALASKSTDASGKVIFSATEMVEGSNFHFSVAFNDQRNWDNDISRALLVSSGSTTMSTVVADMVLDTGISGATSIVSGTSTLLSVTDYPGSYQWSIIAGTNGTLSATTGNEISISSTQQATDDVVTVQLVYTPDGFASETFTIDVFVSAFCDFDGPTWHNKVASGSDGCWGLSFGGSVPTVLDGTTLTFGADGNGNPTAFNNLFAGWGETFQPGFGNEGDVIAVMGDDGITFTIEPQYMGQTLPGPYDYWFRAEGVFDQCTNTIKLVTWDFSYDDFGSAWYGSASGCTAPWIISIQ